MADCEADPNHNVAAPHMPEKPSFVDPDLAAAAQGKQAPTTLKGARY